MISLSYCRPLSLTALSLALLASSHGQSVFSTDFEGPAFTPGTLVADPDWSFDAAELDVEVTTLDFASGLQSLSLTGGSPFDYNIDAALLLPQVLWLDFSLKPIFIDEADLPLDFGASRTAVTGFVKVNAFGEIYAVDGDGLGGGQWIATGSTTALNGDQSQQWLRLTYRLDYTLKTWDLFVDGQLTAVDLGFLNPQASSFEQFTLRSDGTQASGFDAFSVREDNPIYTDADNDAIDDAYEIAQGLSTSLNDRNLDKDFDSLTNLEEYRRNLAAGDADTDGDGVHDGAELSAGADPAVADNYALGVLPYLEGFETLSIGDLNNQDLWSTLGQGATVQSTVSFAGTQAISLLPASGQTVGITRSFDGSDAAQLWLDFYFTPARFAELDTEVALDTDTTAGFYFIEQGQIALFDGDGQGGGIWQSYSHRPSTDLPWERVTILNDYASQSFQIWINGVPVGGSFGFASQQPYMSRLSFRHEGAEAAYIDQISVSANTPTGLDSDGDGLSDEDEDVNGNGIVDPGETDPLLADTDGDGLGDAVAAKLRLWLRSDTGVVSDTSGQVSAWQDQSIYSEDAAQTTSALQPTLIADAYNGQPAMRFDGVDDYLEGLSGFDASAGDFTMVVVHRRTGGHDKSAPFSYSTTTTSYGAPLLRWGPEANNFGINEVGYGPDGVYVDLGADYSDKLYIATASRVGGVSGLNGTLNVRALAHNESVQASGTQSWTSGPATGYFIGKKKVSNDHMFGGDILEILVYEGALDAEQSLMVEQQLAARYGLSLDMDFDGLSDEWEASTFGSFEWTAQDDPDGDGISNIREYNLGTDANTADTTDIIQSNSSLRLRLEASTAVLDGNGNVEQLPDLSGWNDHAVQDIEAQRPALSAASLNGQDALVFDGVDDYLAGLTEFDASAGDFTLIAVAKQSASNGLAATLSYSSSDTALGAPIMRWNRPETGDLGINDVGRSSEGSFVSLGDNAVDQIQLVSIRRSGGEAYGQNGQLTVRALSDMQTLENTTAQSWVSGATDQYFVGRKKTTADGNNDRFSGQVAEILVFDRALNASELLEIEELLAAKYQISLDLDSDGWEDGYERELFGDLSQSPDSDYDSDGLSNARELSLGLDPVIADSHSPVLTLDSLALWLSADQGVTTDAGGLVSQWADISGYGALVEQGSVMAQPTLVADALNTQPAVQFDGVDDHLLGDAGFAPASADYSLFVVHRRTGGHEKAATISFNQPSGSTGAPLLRWGPETNHLGINNVGVNADGVYADLGAASGDYLVSSIIRSVPTDPAANPQLTLSNEGYNGLSSASGEETWDSALSSEFALGRKADGTTHYFGGDIAEVIIFDAALNGDDLATVEAYLKTKYAIDSDLDDDGLDNATELGLGTDPESSDSDGDTLPDAWEHGYGLNPLDATDASANPDGDLLTSLEEYSFGTNPILADSDGDGYQDGYGMAGVVRREIWKDFDYPMFSREARTLFYMLGEFPKAPSEGTFLTKLENTNQEADSYADRTRGFIVPTESQEYILSITGDNISELWLSSDEHRYNMRRVAYLSRGSGFDNWSKFESQTSEAIYLEAGKRYYFELIHFARSGEEEFFRIAWNGLGEEREIITSQNLLSWIPDATDADDDGLLDSWELANGFDVTDDGAANKQEGFFGDSDYDGIPNHVEIESGTNPQFYDSDADGLGDWFEINYFETSPTEETVLDSYQSSSEWLIQNIDTELDGVIYEDDSPEPKLHMFASGLTLGERSSDQTSYFYKTVAGDFSVSFSYDLADQFTDQFTDRAQFGLMARESLSADSRHVTLTNIWGDINRFDLLSRAAVGGFVTGPNLIYSHGADKVWLRMVRRGNEFTAYISLDNSSWSVIATQSLDLPHSLHLGFSLHSFTQWKYSAAVVHVSDWNTDYDRDGIWDADESIYGTSVTDADSDGDGYSDHEEIYEFFTDPTIVDLGAETIADSNTGSESVAELGDWIVDGAVTYSREGRGAVEYDMTLPEDAIYRISLEGQTRFNQTGANLYNVKVSVDGVYIGRIFLNDVESEAGTGRMLSPWLKAGTHTLRFYVDNTYTYRSLQINQVSVGYVGGDDLNQDNIPDWMTNRLAVLNGFDNASPSSVTQSQVSPFCLKGRSRYLSFSAPVDPLAELLPLPAFQFYSDIALDSAADTSFTVDYENDGLTQTAHIEWVETNVADTSEMTIRKGDALRLTAFDVTTLPADDVVIDLGDGSAAVTTTRDTPLEATFDQAGVYTVTATVNSVSHQTTVTVMEANLGDSISLLIDRDFNFQPSALSDDAVVSIDDAVVMEEVTELGQSREFILNGAESEPAVLAASTPSGAVLDHVALNTFYLASNDRTHIQVLETFPDGDQLISTNIVIDNVPDDIELDVNIFVSGVTFSDGSISKTLTAADFDELGRVTLYFIKPASVSSSVCHRITVTVGDTNFGNI